MFFGKPILAYDVIYNRETTENEAHYFKTSEELVELHSKKLYETEDFTKMFRNAIQWTLRAFLLSFTHTTGWSPILTSEAGV